jgi:hypothetical protein
MIAGHALASLVSSASAERLSPEASFDVALDLWSLCPERLLEPPDAVRVREIEQARAAWKKLKRRFER